MKLLLLFCYQTGLILTSHNVSYFTIWFCCLHVEYECISDLLRPPINVAEWNIQYIKNYNISLIINVIILKFHEIPKLWKDTMSMWGGFFFLGNECIKGGTKTDIYKTQGLWFVYFIHHITSLTGWNKLQHIFTTFTVRLKVFLPNRNAIGEIIVLLH